MISNATIKHAVSHGTIPVSARAAEPHTDTLVYRASCTRSLVFQVRQSDRNFPSSTSILPSQPPSRPRPGMSERHRSTQQRLKTVSVLLQVFYICTNYLFLSQILMVSSRSRNRMVVVSGTCDLSDCDEKPPINNQSHRKAGDESTAARHWSHAVFCDVTVRWVLAAVWPVEVCVCVHPVSALSTPRPCDHSVAS